MRSLWEMNTSLRASFRNSQRPRKCWIHREHHRAEFTPPLGKMRFLYNKWIGRIFNLAFWTSSKHDSEPYRTTSVNGTQGWPTISRVRPVFMPGVCIPNLVLEL